MLLHEGVSVCGVDVQRLESLPTAGQWRTYTKECLSMYLLPLYRIAVYCRAVTCLHKGVSVYVFAAPVRNRCLLQGR
jgi:hypothetical protein